MINKERIFDIVWVCVNHNSIFRNGQEIFSSLGNLISSPIVVGRDLYYIEDNGVELRINWGDIVANRDLDADSYRLVYVMENGGFGKDIATRTALPYFDRL